MSTTAKDQDLALKPREKRDLAKLELAIERNLPAFLVAGNALAEIRERRLYRESDQNFEGYCRRRWKFSRSKAYRLISAAEVAQAVGQDGLKLSPIGDKSTPDNDPVSQMRESHARELAFLPPDMQREILEQAMAAGAKPTAGEFRELVRDLAVKRVQEEEESRLTELGRTKRGGPDNGLSDALAQGLRLLERAKRVFGKIGPPAEAVIETVERAILEAGMVSV